MKEDKYMYNIAIFLVLIGLCWLSRPVNANTQREVTLSSTLIRGNLALPGQRVIFTCVTKNSSILEWQSDEHIGTDGDDIQIYSVGSRDNVTSVTIPTTYATRINVTVESGITVIESCLFITASDRFPTSSVTCKINGQGPVKTIFFNTATRALQEVTLSSTLIDEHLAYPGQRVTFTCVTRNSTILEWQSDEHIGTDGDDIQIYSIGKRENVTSVTIPMTYAIRVNVTEINGITVIVSQLIITASDHFPTSSVTCGINSLGPRQTITFNTTVRALQSVNLNSTLIRGNFSYVQQRIVFTCVTRNSTILEWQSNEHIGTDGDDIQIYSVGSRVNVTSVTIPTTYATRVSVIMKNPGIAMIVSQLIITASDRFPTSSVTCGINGLGPRQTISFNTIDEEPPSPTLNSTLQGGVSACPGDRHQLVCRALYAHNIVWISHDYIGRYDMEISVSSPIGRPLRVSGNTDTYAVMDRAEKVNGSFQLTSTLAIVIVPSLGEQNHTVTCLNRDLGTQQSVTFHIAENCELEVTVTSNEVEINMEGDTTAIAVMVAGSIFAIIFVLIMIIAIIFITMCIMKQGNFNVAIKKFRTQAVADPEASRVKVEQSQIQTEARKSYCYSKEAEKSSPEVNVQTSEPELQSTVNTSAITSRLSQGTVTDSDYVSENAGSQSSCHEHVTDSPVVTTSPNQLKSTDTEA